MLLEIRMGRPGRGWVQRDRQTDRQRVWYPRQARPGYRAEWFLLGCLEGLKGEGTAEGDAPGAKWGPRKNLEPVPCD